MNRTVSAVFRRAATSAFLVGALIFAAGFGSSWESDEPELMPHWKASNASSKKTVNHGDWDALLKRYIRMDKTGLNRFAYGKITKSDKARLNRYIENLSKVKVTGFQPQRTARLLAQSLQRTDHQGHCRSLPGPLDPRYRHLARCLFQRSMGQEAGQGRRPRTQSRRHRAPNPAPDLA